MNGEAVIRRPRSCGSRPAVGSAGPRSWRAAARTARRSAPAARADGRAARPRPGTTPRWPQRDRVAERGHGSRPAPGGDPARLNSAEFSDAAARNSDRGTRSGRIACWNGPTRAAAQPCGDQAEQHHRAGGPRATRIAIATAMTPRPGCPRRAPRRGSRSARPADRGDQAQRQERGRDEHRQVALPVCEMTSAPTRHRLHPGPVARSARHSRAARLRMPQRSQRAQSPVKSAPAPPPAC